MGEPTSGPEHASSADASSRPARHKWRWLLGGAGTVILAGASAFAAGLGSHAADRVTASTPPIVSYSASEERSECGMETFVAEPDGARILANGQPDWNRILKLPDAAPAGRDVVQVSIQGESQREVTFTGIYVKVRRHLVPRGTVIAAPCGGPTEGRDIEVNLDQAPPRITGTNSNPHGILGDSESFGPNASTPIKFPWTVSLTDPLLLYIFATTESCDCSWSAEIPWVSGARRGTLHVNNGGKGYSVVGASGMKTHVWEGTQQGWSVLGG